MLCLCHVPNATQAARQEAYGQHLNEAYAQCPGLEPYVEYTVTLSGIQQFRRDLEDQNVNTIVAHYNKEVRAQHFDCWRTRRLAPRLVKQYDAVAAEAQTTFDAAAPNVVLGNDPKEWQAEARVRARKYQMRSIALELAKTRATCVRNASAVAVENAVKCAMAWDDVPEAERQLVLPLFLHAYNYQRALQGIRSTLLSNTIQERYTALVKNFNTNSNTFGYLYDLLNAPDRCEKIRAVF